MTILLSATGQPVRQVTPPPDAASSGGGTVPVAEDEAALREVTRRILARTVMR